MNFCPDCGTPRELNFCRNCGFAFAPAEVATPVEESTQSSPTRIEVAYGEGFNSAVHCANCGEPKAAGFTNCLLCGEAL